MGKGRRVRPDALEAQNAPRWLVVRDKLNTPLEWLELAPGTDLRQVMERKRLEMIKDGWRVEPIPRLCAFFFASEGADEGRLQVAIEGYEPGHNPAPLGHGSPGQVAT